MHAGAGQIVRFVMPVMFVAGVDQHDAARRNHCVLAAGAGLQLGGADGIAVRHAVHTEVLGHIQQHPRRDNRRNLIDAVLLESRGVHDRGIDLDPAAQRHVFGLMAQRVDVGAGVLAAD